MTKPLVTVFGGSGFIGRYVVRALARDGWRVRVALRRPNSALFLKPLGEVGQIDLVQANIRDDESVARAVRGADAVVNLVGILYESGHQTFAEIQAEGAARVARAAAAAGARRLVQVSAIGADAASPAAYARAKAAGEASVAEAFPGATILRPSIVFGPEDKFYNLFAGLARVAPALPLIGGGLTRFQPVYVVDVAEAVTRVLADPKTAGQTYELGGPSVYTFKQVLEMILAVTEQKRLLVTIPWPLARLQARVLGLLPNPLLTPDQVTLLEVDNVSDPAKPGLAALGIEATPVEAILPLYLRRFRRSGEFSTKTA